MDEDEGKPISWRRLEFVSVAAFALTMACVFIGQAAERFAGQDESSPRPISQKGPAFNAVDYDQTGSVKTGAVIIGPCDTHKP